MITDLPNAAGPASASHRTRTWPFGAEVSFAGGAAVPVADPASCLGGFTGGRYCPMAAFDIAAFGDRRRGDDVQLLLRTAMYNVLKGAFARSGLRWVACHREDRGDGVLVVGPPGLPATALIDPLVDHVCAAIRRHNKLFSDLARLSLRMSVHAGHVHFDENGVSGNAVNHLFRMLDAVAFKRVVSASGCHFALVVSEVLFDDVISHAPGLVDPAMYAPISLHRKETRTRGWVYLPPVPNPFLSNLTGKQDAPGPAQMRRNRGGALVKTAARMTKRQAGTCGDDIRQPRTPHLPQAASADAPGAIPAFTSATSPGDPPLRDSIPARARLVANAVSTSRRLATMPGTAVSARVRERLQQGQRVRQL